MLLSRLIILIICLTATVTIANAQNPQKILQKANQSFAELGYAKSIELYESLLKKSKGLTEQEIFNTTLKLALSYKNVKDYNNAERVYRDILSKNPILKGDDIKAYQHYAQVLASNGKHQEAKTMYLKYSDLQEQDKRGEQFAKLYSNLDALQRNAGSYKVEYVGINSGHADFSPVYYKNGLVFVSGRSANNGIKRVFNWDNSSFLDLFYLEDIKTLGTENTSSISTGSSTNTNRVGEPTKKLGQDYYTPPTSNDANTIGHKGSEKISGSKDYEENPSIETKKFSKSLNSKYHEGPCTFFHDFSKVVFTRNSQSTGGIIGNKKEGVNRLKLYTAEYNDKEWRNIKEFPYNSPDFSCGHPTLTIDDKIMYFVSDMPGGYGGTDIWMTRFNNGDWTKPVNLGGKVNTRGNEMFPYVDERGNLYFSTDGMPGLGDLDIFFIPMNTATSMPSGVPRNLGAPLNSTRDDFGIITDSERRVGYFSSNRKRGGVDDDIWKFTRMGTLYGCREVIVSLKDKDTKKPMEKMRFEYANKDDPNSKESAVTSSEGTIKLCLEADNEFKFTFSQNGYQSKVVSFSNFEASDFEASKLDVELKAIEPVNTNHNRKNNNTPINNEPRMRIVSRQNKNNNKSTLFRGIVTAGKDSTPVAGVLVRFENQCDHSVQLMTTKADGSYEFKRELNCDYKLEASRDGFGVSSELVAKVEEKRSLIAKIFTKKKTTTVPTSLFDTKLYKVGDVVKLDNIYYDSDSWKLRKEAAKELDRLASILTKYPNMLIEISSHTDTRGNAQDNLALSQKRITEVLDYLSKKGIARNRMRGIGKGESEPVNICNDGVQCTEAEHQRNRRTEFKVLSIERRL
jgi:outer membrane protein OmpA-like peptidoglycan-associated protein